MPPQMPACRAIRIVAGLVLIVIGLAVIGGTGGIIVALVGLLPLATGAANVCLLGKLFGSGSDGKAV